MRAVYSSLNLVEAHHLKNLLRASGIRCQIRNEDLVFLFGEMPFPECGLEVLVEREEDLAAAEAVVRDFLRPQPRILQAWRCRGCGETIEGQFTACWSCGANR